MRFHIEQRFNAELNEVEAALLDPGLLRDLAALPRLGGAELLDEQVTGDRVTRKIRYHFTAELSSAVTAVVDPDKLTWVEQSVHDRATHHTTWTIVPDHYANRLTCAGTFQLTSNEPGITIRTAEAEIKVRFPLVGSRVEKAIVLGLTEHAVDEQAAINRFLLG